MQGSAGGTEYGAPQGRWVPKQARQRGSKTPKATRTGKLSRERRRPQDREIGRGVSKLDRSSSRRSSTMKNFSISAKQIEWKKKCRSFYFLAVSQDPAKRAQFRVAVLGGGARPRECARGDRPGGGRGTRSAGRARENRRSRARDQRRTDPGLRPRR